MINGGTSTAPSAPSGIHATVYKILFPDSITIAKLDAVFISMDGVAMTTVGKTWAVDEFLSASEEDKYVVNKLC
ncbi:hypothetical protein CUMW_279380 [Citrus unshiu]|uniref:Uncharacterized protein n=1 Tax=Citrus unshiu TaxID=55188 RepID=A0A2H5N7G6_CITUN|nr:hypothetical protein CUMW_279380 [Citrus unshiu]